MVGRCPRQEQPEGAGPATGLNPENRVGPHLATAPETTLPNASKLMFNSGGSSPEDRSPGFVDTPTLKGVGAEGVSALLASITVREFPDRSVVALQPQKGWGLTIPR